jgi:hypothetical protein
MRDLGLMINVEYEQNPLVSLQRMIYSIQEYEFRYLEANKKAKGKKMKLGPEWSPPLIDIWQDRDSFILEVNREKRE